MTSALKKLFKLSVCIALLLPSVKVNAQVSLIQNAINKLESYKNFSYQLNYTQIDGGDTLIKQQKDIFLKVPADKTFGYLFSTETLYKGYKEMLSYDGQNILSKLPDSTYVINQYKASDVYGQSLLRDLKWMESRLEKRTAMIAADTTINGIISSHIIVNAYDTVIDKEHLYSRAHLFVDKLSGLPDCIITKGRFIGYGERAMNSYIESCYSGYKFDTDNISVASFGIPNGFREHKKRAPFILLPMGAVAPDWTLYTADGKKVSLSQMKGKVVLLDFYFIGCPHCMQAITPLKNLYEKYKNQNLVIVSITERDSKKSVLAFEKKYGIKYPGLVNATDVVKSYQVDSAPNFYFIDKEGKIAKTVVGYNDDFETTATFTIDGLLNK